MQVFEALRLLPPFPQEPVGAGAVWALEQPSMLPEPVWTATTVTIEELDEARYRLRTEETYELWQEWVDWQQQAAEETEGVTPPASWEVDGQGTGEIEGPLGGFLPDHASRSLEITTLAESPEGERFEGTTRIEDRLEGD